MLVGTLDDHGEGTVRAGWGEHGEAVPLHLRGPPRLLRLKEASKEKAR